MDIHAKRPDCSHCGKFRCKNSPHFWWIMATAVIIICILATWVGQGYVVHGDRIKAFITDAGLLLSITLSIFAIAYTYTSNNNTSRQFEKINSAAELIVDTANRVTEAQVSLNQQMKTILDNVGDIKRDTHNITDAMTKNDNKDFPSFQDLQQPPF